MVISKGFSLVTCASFAQAVLSMCKRGQYTLVESPPEQTMKEDNKKPLGIQLIEGIKKSSLSFKTSQVIVLIVTIFAYTSYHANRKTTSFVKQALDPQSLGIGPNLPWQGNSTSNLFRDGWFPFNGPDGTAMLGDLDVAFLFVYAIGMYFSGHVSDRMDLRVFLTAGMLGTGLFTALFGVGYWANVHNFYYYDHSHGCWIVPIHWMAMTSCSGRELVLKLKEGTYNGHLEFSHLCWEHYGVIIHPESVGGNKDGDEVLCPRKEDEELNEPLLRSDREEESAVGFIEAWKIPRVAPFALCLFFAKGVVGGILAGYISDQLDARAITAASFVSLNGNSRALATVTAIIDGTGSIGAAVGPLLTGYISAMNWNAVFVILMGAALVVGLFFTRLVVT
ncbi:putative cytochrome 71D7-like [Capsicum annuum]|nr:putative cytochrome 71D7-like [Capsicum annuum]